MYLDTYDVSTAREVVEVYIDLVTDWIKNVEGRKSLEECYPLDTTTDKDTIELLKKRLNF